MKYAEQKSLVSDLRALADFYERPESIELPAFNLYETFFIGVYEYLDQFDDDGNLTGSKYMLNPEKSNKKLKKIVRALGSCTKDWADSTLRVVKLIGDGVRLAYQVDREAVCRKVPTGRVIVHAASTHYSPERTEEEFEWVCDDVALLAD